MTAQQRQSNQQKSGAQGAAAKPAPNELQLQLQSWNQYLLQRADQLGGWAKGTGLDPRTLIRIAVRELQSDSKLRDCTRESFYLALTAAAQLGLEPTGITGEAYIIPYGTKATFIPGYQGLVKLAYQTGLVHELWADVAHKNDHFRVVRGSDPRLEHEPVIVGERGDVIAAYACARLSHGGVRFEVLTMSEIGKIRDSSKAGRSGPWQEWFEEMAKKTAIRRLCKTLPKTPLLAKAIALDTAAEAGQHDRVPAILDVEADDERPIAAPDTAAKNAIRQAVAQRQQQRAAAAPPSNDAAPAEPKVEMEPEEALERYAKLEDALQAAYDEKAVDEILSRGEGLPDAEWNSLLAIATKRKQELSRG